MPYLSAVEVCSRRGAIQIHVYLYLPLPFTCILAPVCHKFFPCILPRCIEDVMWYVVVIVYFVKHNSSQVLKWMFCRRLLRLFDLWQKWVGLLRCIGLEELLERGLPSASWPRWTGIMMMQYVSQCSRVSWKFLDFFLKYQGSGKSWNLWFKLTDMPFMYTVEHHVYINVRSITATC